MYFYSLKARYNNEQCGVHTGISTVDLLPVHFKLQFFSVLERGSQNMYIHKGLRY
jgi:hypothetical protein